MTMALTFKQRGFVQKAFLGRFTPRDRMKRPNFFVHGHSKKGHILGPHAEVPFWGGPN